MTQPVSKFPENLQFAAIQQAAERIRGHAHLTPVFRSSSIDELARAELLFKCENLQRVGAFKFRGACNAVWSLQQSAASHGVVTHSSGNHGAALALAARTRGIPAHVVVPDGAVQSKVEAIKAYGATLHRCAATLAAREQTADAVCAQTGATLIHPYTDPAVIAGQGTAALEFMGQVPALDALITPVGGGGLISGTAIASAAVNPGMRVFAAEPTGAADTWASLHSGGRVVDFEPNTICDGLRALVGAINLNIIREHRVNVLTVSDEDTISAMRLIWQRLKLLVEPSAATALAAVLTHRAQFAGKRVGLILSGGNVDLDHLPWTTVAKA